MSDGGSKASVRASRRRIFTHSGWLGSAQIIVGALSLLQAMMLTRALGDASFGVFALILAFVATVSQLLNSRVWEAIIKFVPHFQERDEHGRATVVLQLCYLVELAAAVLGMGFVLLSADLVEHLLIKDAGAAALLRFYAVIILLNAPQEATIAVLRLNDRFRLLAAQSVAVAILRTVGIALVWWLDPTIRSMLIVQLVAAAAGLAMLVVMGIRGARAAGLDITRWPRLSALRRELRELKSFLVLTHLIGTGRIVTTQADVLVVGLLSTPATVGVYELARRLIAQLRALSNPLYEASFPEISKLVARGSLAEVRKLQSSLSWTLLAAVAPFCVLGTLLAPWVIPTFFGSEFQPSVQLFQILIWQLLLWLPLIWFPGFLLATGRERTLMVLNTIDASLFLILLFALVSRFDAFGAATATLLHHLLWALMAFAILTTLRRREAAR